MFEAYITNTALYPLMGIEVGTTVHFPTTTQELQAALAKIGIDGKRYREVFFTSFDSDVLGLYDHLYECENIDELNELGHALLEVRDKGGLEKPDADTRAELKSSGFRWAPSVGAWQRQLTDNAIRAADRLECIKPLSG